MLFKKKKDVNYCNNCKYINCNPYTKKRKQFGCINPEKYPYPHIRKPNKKACKFYKSMFDDW